MAASNLLLLIITFLLLHCFSLSCSARHLTALVSDQPLIPMTYHNGALLTGPISLNLIWYGNFTPSQRAIVTDFLSSLSSKSTTTTNHQPSVATWWSTTRKYFAQTKTRFPTLTVGDHILDPSYSLGKSLSSSQLAALASKGRRSYAVNIVLTSADVAVEGFCMSRCGTHGSSSSSSRTKSGRFAYIWVGNSAEQCPGQCAWPFNQPAYGPQTDALVAPNGDVGVDGMVVTLAEMLVGTVTNPFGSGFFQGPKEAPLEAGSACSGVYGKGAYPGYAGELLVDPTTGASYNANGVHGRRYLLPALFDPLTQACSMLV